MVRFLLVLALAAAVRAERWRLLFGLALLGFGGLVVIFASMLGVFERARTQAAALREPVLPVGEEEYA